MWRGGSGERGARVGGHFVVDFFGGRVRFSRAWGREGGIDGEGGVLCRGLLWAAAMLLRR